MYYTCLHWWIEHSVQFSSVVSNSLQPHESQHARPPCPSPTPGVHSDSRPSSQCCHPAISSSVIPFSFPESLPASESFPISQLFAWSDQSTGVPTLASFLPKKSQGWLPSFLKKVTEIKELICEVFNSSFITHNLLFLYCLKVLASSTESFLAKYVDCLVTSRSESLNYLFLKSW